MKPTYTDKNTGISYTLVGEVYLPNLVLPHTLFALIFLKKQFVERQKTLTRVPLSVYNITARRYYLCICCNADNLGLSFGSGAIVGGEYIPRHFLFWWSLMKELSIFIDESGDFGEVVNTSPYYIVTFIFHDQADDISPQIERLDKQLKDCDFADEYIHIHPIIRKETPYHYLTIDERRQILNKMLRFTMACDISYFNIVVNKNEANDKFKLSARIAKELSGFVKEHLDYFQSYDNIIVYYDYGQQELSVIINTILMLNFLMLILEMPPQKDINFYKSPISFARWNCSNKRDFTINSRNPKHSFSTNQMN